MTKDAKLRLQDVIDLIQLRRHVPPLSPFSDGTVNEIHLVSALIHNYRFKKGVRAKHRGRSPDHQDRLCGVRAGFRLSRRALQ